MYRSPDETPRCPCCQSTDLGPATQFDPSEGYAQVNFRRTDVKPGFTTTDRVSIRLTRARVCMSCGHAMLFVRRARLEWMRENAQVLEPLADE